MMNHDWSVRALRLYWIFYHFVYTESKFPVKTKWIVADFSRGKEIYSDIEQELSGIPVGILGNFQWQFFKNLIRSSGFSEAGRTLTCNYEFGVERQKGNVWWNRDDHDDISINQSSTTLMRYVYYLKIKKGVMEMEIGDHIQNLFAWVKCALENTNILLDLESLNKQTIFMQNMAYLYLIAWMHRTG